MTVSTTNARYSYSANGSQTAFSFPRFAQAAADFVVTVTTAAGVESTKTLTTHYTVTGAGTSWTITFGTAPASGSTVTILRDPSPVQETDFESEGDPLDAVNDSTDRIVSILQSLKDSAVKKSPGTPTGFDPALPNPAAGTAGQAVILNGTKTGLAFGTVVTGGVISSVMLPVVTASSTEEALAALGASVFLENIAALKAETGGFTEMVYVRARTTEGDGGGGFFYWDAAASATGDDAVIVTPDAGGTGRWRRQYTLGIVSAEWFGAAGDDATDNATAIAAAATALGTLGGTILFGRGTYQFTSKLTFTTPIVLKGCGWIYSAIRPVSFGATTDNIEFAPSAAVNCAGAGMEDIFLGNPLNGTRTGQIGVYLNTQTAGANLPKFRMRDVYIAETTNGTLTYALRHTNNNTNNVNGGLYTSIFERCTFEGGAYFDGSGDSITLDHCVCSGPNAGVYINQVAGAQAFSVVYLNCTSVGGAVVIDRAAKFRIAHGNFEQTVSTTQTNSAMVDINMATGAGIDGVIEDNHFGAFTGTGVSRIIRIANCANVEVNNNKLVSGIASMVGTLVTATASKTRIGPNTYNVNVTTKVSDSGADTWIGDVVVRKYTATGINVWTKKAGLVGVFVKVIGAGGGGGGGCRSASGTANSGGGGGGSGNYLEGYIPADDLSSSHNAEVGVKGTGGAGSTVNGTPGTDGTAGGASGFGSFMIASGGGYGAGGRQGENSGGGGAGGAWDAGGNASGVTAGATPSSGFGAAGGSASVGGAGNTSGGGGGGQFAVAGFAGGASLFGPGGGGAGGGVTTGPVGTAGGDGGRCRGIYTAPAGGALGGNAGTTGTQAKRGPGAGGGGGGGNASGVGGRGGDGIAGSGGGGGGAGIAANGGRGGDGGNGYIEIWEFYGNVDGVSSE